VKKICYPVINISVKSEIPLILLNVYFQCDGFI
jgi:hypothetical protein